METKYIVEFGEGKNKFWLADWEGDPGRTLVREHAKKFKSFSRAKNAMDKAVEDNSHRKLKGHVTEY